MHVGGRPLNQREIEALEDRTETAESVAQMAAHDRDEALENFAHVEQEYERLQQAARSILWMAREYAEAGGRGGPEMQDYEAAAAIIEGDDHPPASTSAGEAGESS